MSSKYEGRDETCPLSTGGKGGGGVRGARGGSCGTAPSSRAPAGRDVSAGAAREGRARAGGARALTAGTFLGVGEGRGLVCQEVGFVEEPFEPQALESRPEQLRRARRRHLGGARRGHSVRSGAGGRVPAGKRRPLAAAPPPGPSGRGRAKLRVTTMQRRGSGRGVSGDKSSRGGMGRSSCAAPRVDQDRRVGGHTKPSPKPTGFLGKNLSAGGSLEPRRTRNLGGEVMPPARRRRRRPHRGRAAGQGRVAAAVGAYFSENFSASVLGKSRLRGPRKRGRSQNPRVPCPCPKPEETRSTHSRSLVRSSGAQVFIPG